MIMDELQTMENTKASFRPPCLILQPSCFISGQKNMSNCSAVRAVVEGQLAGKSQVRKWQKNGMADLGFVPFF